MKNIHVLSTHKPSRLIYNDANDLCYQSNKSYKNDRKWMHRKKFNIYITSDEEIKPYDWGLSKLNEVKYMKPDGGVFCKKIILTTDQDLIKDGVQSIDDEFLEWFVKNPSCEEVKTYYIPNEFRYEIIIPKEEPKQTAVEWYEKEINSLIEKYQAKEISERDFIVMKHNLFYPAKKMEREQQGYSEEDIINALHSLEIKDNKDYSKIYDGMKKCFEVFKKK